MKEVIIYYKIAFVISMFPVYLIKPIPFQRLSSVFNVVIHTINLIHNFLVHVFYLSYQTFVSIEPVIAK